MLDRFEAGAYPAGEVEPIEGEVTGEEAEPDDPTSDPGAGDLARRGFAGLVEIVSGEAPEGSDLDAESSYDLAARVELPSDTKQRLLELRSEPERMRVLARAFEALVVAVERSREVAERARMNGKVIVSPADED